MWHFGEKKKVTSSNSVIIQFISYLCMLHVALQYWNFTKIQFALSSQFILFLLLLFFLRFLSYFHVSVLARSHRIPRTRSNAYPMLCVTHVPTPQIRWIGSRKEAMGKIRVQWYITLTGIAVAVRRGSCFIPVIRRLSHGLYLSQLLSSDVDHSVLILLSTFVRYPANFFEK